MEYNPYTLYSLTEAYQKAIEGGYTFDEETGEVFWEPSQLEEIEEALALKADACAAYRKNMLAFADALKSEAAVLSERAKLAEKQAKKLDPYLVACVEMNGEAIEGMHARISTRKSEAVDVIDEEAFFEKYESGRLDPSLVSVKVTKTPNKTEIKKAIKGGKEVPGCALVVNKNLSLR